MPTDRSAVVPLRDRLLALGLLLGVLAAVHVLVLHPLWVAPMLALEEELVQVRERQGRVEAELAQAPVIAERLAQAQAELGSRPGFLPEASAEQASSALVQRLEQAVTTASPGNRSCAITSRSPLPVQPGNAPFVRVSLQARLRCGTPELQAVLHALETGHPRLAIENLTLLAQRYQSMPGETGAGLDVAFELVGYLDPALAAPAGGEHGR